MTWELESYFQNHLVNLLSESRTEIVIEYSPFDFATYKIDIKCRFSGIDEWRELKLLNYPLSGSALQNFWTGVGKVIMMRRLQIKYLSGDYDNILRIPDYDFDNLIPQLRENVPEAVIVELVTDSEFISNGGD